jgi:predicted ATPase
LRLKSVYISKYKNLKDFTLTFDGTSFIDVFVGKNGSGKSNFFEAVIEIFRFLYERETKITFEFQIIYEIENKNFEIEYKKNKLSVNRSTRKKSVLPDNVLMYYSGHNSLVKDIVIRYENSFKSRIQKAKIDETRKFIGIGIEYKQILLAVLLLQDNKNKAREFIVSKLGIKSISSEIQIILKKPYFQDNKYKIDLGDASTHYWGAKGITKLFIDRLLTCYAKGPVRSEGYQVDKNEYILYLSIEKIQKEFRKTSVQELFVQFDNLKTIEMLKEISISLKLENGTDTTIDHFSDGQFQSIYIFSIMEIFKNSNCITLLDEPDSFLHPEWQFEFLKQLFEITDTTAKNNHVLMSSHSAATICTLKTPLINMFEIYYNRIKIQSYSKNDVIKNLSKGLMTLTENEIVMSINSYLKNTKNPVLFTEGITDVCILEYCLEKII